MSAKALEEKHQKIIRGLMLEPDNKKCFDCQTKGPVYVCLNFGTFICTTCSGIHREFNHRVKSISMATFKPEEVEFLKTHGNGVARREWLARWNPDDFPEPDASDQQRLRQFMKLKYQDKRWVNDPRNGASAPQYHQRNDRPPERAPERAPERQQERTREPPRSEVRPLTDILGKDIPPIQFQNQSQAKPAAHQSTDLMGSEVKRPSVKNDLDGLFDMPSEHQQQQFHQQQAQYQHQQQQAQYNQLQQNIMAQFAHAPPPQQAPAGWFNPNQQQQFPPQAASNPFGSYPGSGAQFPQQQQQQGWGGPQTQAGFPQQGGFPQQQNGFAPQQQGGFPPQQGGFPPAGAGATPFSQQPFGAPAQQPVQPQPPKEEKFDIFSALSPLSAKPAAQGTLNPRPAQQPAHTQPAAQQANPFGDPFGDSFGSSAPPAHQPSQHGATSPNPFGGGGFGQAAPTNNHAQQNLFAQSPANPSSGFGQPAQSQGGFGQPQNQGGFGQPAQSQGFGQFGQPGQSQQSAFSPFEARASPNPFGAASQQPQQQQQQQQSTPFNPFL